MPFMAGQTIRFDSFIHSCTVRNGIYRIDLDGSNMEYLSKGFDCVRHPTLNPTRNELFFIATNQGGPHNPINKLYKMDLDTHVSECIIESVGEPADDASFPGLFIWDMLLNPWLDTNTLLLTSQWRFRTTILMIDVRHKTVQDITPGKTFASTTLSFLTPLHIPLHISLHIPGHCTASERRKEKGKDGERWRDEHVDVTHIAYVCV